MASPAQVALGSFVLAVIWLVFELLSAPEDG